MFAKNGEQIDEYVSREFLLLFDGYTARKPLLGSEQTSVKKDATCAWMKLTYIFKICIIFFLSD
jgi:hypothetical protein